MVKVTLDIGGSKMRGYTYENGEKIKFEIAGDFASSEEKRGINKPFVKALKKQFGRGRYEVNAVAINLGGKNKGQIQSSAKAVFPKAKIFISRESEGDIAFEILRTYQADILVMAGTGCIAQGKNHEKSMVVGGWGRDIGDEGSGYSIGIMAINRALKELDSGKQDLSILTKELLPFKTPFNFKDISEYAQKRDFARSCLPKTRQEIARIAKTVANCAEKGCQLSQEILKENGKEIAKWIELLAKRLEVENPKVVINGGITNTKKFWEEEIRGVREVIFTNDGIDFALKNIVERL